MGNLTPVGQNSEEDKLFKKNIEIITLKNIVYSQEIMINGEMVKI